MVQTAPEVLLSEIKYKRQIVPHELWGIKSFMRRYACRKGLVITRGEEEGSFAVQRGAEKSKRQVKILGRLNRDQGVRNLRNVVAHLHLNNSKTPFVPSTPFKKFLTFWALFIKFG